MDGIFIELLLINKEQTQTVLHCFLPSVSGSRVLLSLDSSVGTSRRSSVSILFVKYTRITLITLAGQFQLYTVGTLYA